MISSVLISKPLSKPRGGNFAVGKFLPRRIVNDRTQADRQDHNEAEPRGTRRRASRSAGPAAKAAGKGPVSPAGGQSSKTVICDLRGRRGGGHGDQERLPAPSGGGVRSPRRCEQDHRVAESRNRATLLTTVSPVHPRLGRRSGRCATSF